MSNNKDLGFITLYRSARRHPLYLNPDCWLVFTELFWRAAFDDRRWVNHDGNEICLERGQAVCGLSELAKARRLTMQRVRTAIQKLKKWDVITTKTTNRGTIVTFCNYDTYNPRQQPSNKQVNKQTTNKQQANNNPVTTNKEIEELKELQNSKYVNEISSLAENIQNLFRDYLVVSFNETKTWPSPPTQRQWIADMLRWKDESVIIQNLEQCIRKKCNTLRDCREWKQQSNKKGDNEDDPTGKKRYGW